MLDNRFQTLNDQDVISILSDAHHIVTGLKNFQSQELYQIVRRLLKLTDAEQPNYHWLGNGVEARLLKSSQSTAGWIVGHIKLCLTFQPAELGSITNPVSSYIPQYDDVLEIADELARLTSRQSSLLSEIALVVRQHLKMTDLSESRYYWLDRGIECKVLKSSGEMAGWQSGLIRLQFEFIPASINPMGGNLTVSQVGLDSLRQLAVN
jgi:hypothetical protein